uniref:V-type proton ATPase subunit a n=1 Tax=Caenorhabditis japonica TaxID=281687 RepID=A0A8R1E7R3_CAEJA
LNPNVNNFQRTFVKDIRRFDEMERKLRFLENQIVKDQIVVAGRVDNGEYTILPTSEVNTLEGTLSELEKDVKSMNSSDAQLKANFMDLKEWDAVLDKTDEFFQGGVDDQAQEELENLDEEGAIRVDKGPVTIWLESLVVRDSTHSSVCSGELVIIPLTFVPATLR